jgi:hypothetical protein
LRPSGHPAARAKRAAKDSGPAAALNRAKVASVLSLDALKSAYVATTPFRFLIAEGALSAEDAAAIRRDFPDIRKSGFFPLANLKGGEAFNRLVADLRSPELAGVLSEKLVLDLKGRPRLITVRRRSKAGDGRSHNDSESKICTMLVYLNERWDKAEGGAIRALNGPDDMEDYAAEVAPLAGRVFAFARSETSWHGHPPFAGERYVVQTTFLRSEADLERKEHRGGLQFFLKQLNPFAR